MEGNTSFDWQTYTNELDAIMAPVMPETAIERGRVTIHTSEELSDAQKKLALGALTTLSEGLPDKPTEKLARMLIKRIQDREL